METTRDPSSPDAAPFSSRWARALDGDREALRELAGSYWYCIYAWWRRTGEEDAATATVTCFSRWLTDSPPHAEQPGAGRLREWLRARLAEVEGSLDAVSEPAITIAPEWAEERYAREPEGDADEIFQRRWALTVLEFTMDALRAEYEARGEAALFAEVMPYASFEGGDESRYEATAQRMGFTVGAARKAVFDFRARHRELLRGLISDTVADPADIESELTALLIACDMPGTPGAAAPLPTVIGSLKPDELFARAMQSVRMTSGGAGLWTPPTDAEVARLFPQYEMLGILGRGGMGAVYKGRQIELDRLVAIKLLPLEISVDKDFADRFRREARAMAKLSHPHIIAVHDFGTTSEGHLYFVMEFIEGANLQHMIHGPGLAAEQALAIMDQVCTALAYAHGKGVIHRDIKPANVMVDTEGNVKVADFGLARLTDPGAEQMGHTMTGTVMGTPDYMAPEQSRGMNVDHRADIYSLGVMLYEMLCREVPKGIFDPPSERIGCDTRIDEIVKKAMQSAPERRFQSTAEMRTAITEARTIPAAAIVPAPHTQPISGPTQHVQPRAVAKPAALQPRGAAVEVIAPPAATSEKSKLPIYSAIAAAVIALGIGAFVLFGKKGSQDSGTGRASTGAIAGEKLELTDQSGRAKPPVPAPPAKSLSSSDWSPLVSEQKWRTPDSTREFKDGMVHLFHGGVSGPLSSVDGAIRARIRIREGTRSPGVLTGKPSDGGHYKLELMQNMTGVSLTLVPPGKNPSYKSFSNLGQHTFAKPLQPGDALDLELRTEGDHFIGKVNGVAVIDAHDAQLPHPRHWGLTGEDGWFESAEVQVAGASNVATASPSPTLPASKPPAPGAAARAYAGHRIQLVEKRLNWQQAKADAEAAGGHLAIIGDKAKLDWIAANLSPRVNFSYWLGGTKAQGSASAWRWEDGSPVDAALWLPGQPDVGGAAAGAKLGRLDDRIGLDDSALDSDVAGYCVEWDTTPTAATKEAPFVNSLGMKFVPVPITGGRTKDKRVLFSIWETRVQDYEAFVKETGREWSRGNVAGEPTHPAGSMTWEDAVAFCNWLTERERKGGHLAANEVYRLPRDSEWSCAVGIGHLEADDTPAGKNKKLADVYPWGGVWPPPSGTGNFSGEETIGVDFGSEKTTLLQGYRDNFPKSAPVGSFPANPLGIFDLAGNVWELCDDIFVSNGTERPARGGSFTSGDPPHLLSSTRSPISPTAKTPSVGFRIVLAPAAP